MKGLLKTSDADYKAYGLTKNQSEPWEDGQRLDPSNLNSGEFEWWYTDGHLSNGLFFVVNYYYEVDKKGNPFSFININMANEKGSIIEKRIDIDYEKVFIQKDFCNTQFNKHFIKSLDGLDKYEIYLDPDEIEGNCGLHIIIDKTVPTYKPGTGYWDADGKYFAWLCAVPSANIKGTITINGEIHEITGSGYHDHNWGNCPMNEILGDWLWSPAEVDGITTVTSSVRFNPANGGEETKFVYLAKGHEVLIDAINDEVVCLEGEKVPHPNTGKKISSDCMYIVNGAKGYNYIRFQGQQLVASFPFGENSEWRTWYARFVSKTVLDLKINGKEIKGEAHSTLEVMDFFGERK